MCNLHPNPMYEEVTVHQFVCKVCELHCYSTVESRSDWCRIPTRCLYITEDLMIPNWQRNDMEVE